MSHLKWKEICKMFNSNMTPTHTPKSGTLSVYFDHYNWYVSTYIANQWHWHPISRSIAISYIERGYSVEIK